MSATTVGKILVFANLVLGVVFASMALGVYTNRIDWPGARTASYTGEEVRGELAQRVKDVKDAELVASAALTRWQDMTKKLYDLELKARPTAQAWYADKMMILDQGKDRAGQQQPVTSLVHNKDGQLVVFQNGQPVPGPIANQPLQSRSYYEAQLAATAQAIQNQVNLTNEALVAAEELTVRINGIPSKQKGLRDLLSEEETARRNALDELEYVKPFRYNRQAEAELLYKRQMALEARVAELNKP
jgi:hypothetical protein